MDRPGLKDLAVILGEISLNKSLSTVFKYPTVASSPLLFMNTGWSLCNSALETKYHFFIAFTAQCLVPSAGTSTTWSGNELAFLDFSVSTVQIQLSSCQSWHL